jgi:hypothetical protein
VTTYVYQHPQETGFGQHHADGDLASRPAQPPEAAASLRGALALINATDEQKAGLEKFLSRTMADLDMHHGTEVTHVGRDEERNLELVEWTDQHGDARRTSITPEMFFSHFTAKAGA